MRSLNLEESFDKFFEKVKIAHSCGLQHIEVLEPDKTNSKVLFMKLTLITSLFVLTSSAFAAHCLESREASSRCDIQVVGNTLSECHITYNPRDIRPTPYPGINPYVRNYPRGGAYSLPWRRVEIGEEVSSCDISLDDCQYLAFRKLNKFEYVNNCGGISRGVSVNYRYLSLNNDGTVAEEVSGRMKK